MNKIIKQKIDEFNKEERNITKKYKNLIIDCLESNYLDFEKLQERSIYHVWSQCPTCTIRLVGKDEILKIEKEFHSYYEENDSVSYDIYGKSGIIVRSCFTNISLKKELLEAFKFSPVALEIIEYIYSGKSFEVYDQLSWENCIN